MSPLRLTLHDSQPLTPPGLHFEVFLLDREAARCTPKTMTHYTYTLGTFVGWLQEHGLNSPADITPHQIRAYLVGLQKRGLRDRAMTLALLDSGLRASEFVGLQVNSVDMRSGLVTMTGKGHKQRTVRFGAKTRQATLRYLARRLEATQDSPLWIAHRTDGEERGPLTLRGLQMVFRNLGEKAGVMPCHPHKFRRTFALWCLRDGMDLHSLRLLMGHSSLAVLQRYLALAGEDIERAHKLHSPVDNLCSVAAPTEKGHPAQGQPFQ